MKLNCQILQCRQEAVTKLKLFVNQIKTVGGLKIYIIIITMTYSLTSVNPYFAVADMPNSDTTNRLANRLAKLTICANGNCSDTNTSQLISLMTKIKKKHRLRCNMLCNLKYSSL